MKKLSIIVLCLLSLLLVGCSSNKESITGDEYVSKMGELGYTPSDVTDKFGYATAAYGIKTETITVSFVSTEKNYDIEGIFLDECENVYKEAEEGYTKTIKGGSNWTSLKVTDDKNIYYVTYINHTLLYIKGDINSKARVNTIIEELGY